MSLAYRWTPEEIAALTLAQLTLYLSRDIECGAHWVAPDEARQRRSARRAVRNVWIHDVTEVLQRGISTT